MRRRPVRPVFYYALAAAAAGAWALTLLPSPAQRAYRRLASEQAALEAAGCESLASAAGRRRYLEHLGALQVSGLNRRLREMAALSMRCPAFPPEDARALLDVVFHDLRSWNSRPPRWKLAVLERYRGALPRTREDLGALYRFAPVTLTYRASKPHERLWVEGGWDASGALDALGGWGAEPLVLENGVWVRRRPLTPTIGNTLYHAVIRTAPWPAGEAVAYARFRVDGPREVAFEALRPEPRRARTLAAAEGPPARLAVLGVDAASWHVLMPLIHAGRLPNFTRLLREGAAAELASTGDYGSLSNIYVAMTGKIASRHGMDVHDYFRLDAGVKARPLWRIASDAGRRTLAVSMWQTFPPGALFGAMVTEAFFSLDLYSNPAVKRFAMSRDVLLFAEAFGISGASVRNLFRLMGWIDGAVATTHPPELEEPLKASLPRPDGVDDLPSLTRHLDRSVAAVIETMTRRESFELICAYLSAIDNASHMFWAGFEPSAVSFLKTITDPKVRQAAAKLPAAEGRLARSYEDADEVLGGLMSRARNVLVFSDHGFGSGIHDYLVLQFKADAFLEDWSRRGGPAVPEGSEVDGSQRHLLWLPADERGWAYGRALIAEMSQARYLPHGSPMFGEFELARKAGRLALRFLQLQPRPVFINALEIGGRRRSVMDFFSLTTQQGVHHGNGVLGLWGADVKAGRIEDAHIADVAPTALRLLGLPEARDMDGAALAQALRGGEGAVAVASYGGGGSPWWRLVQSLRARRAARQLWTRLTQ